MAKTAYTAAILLVILAIFFSIAYAASDQNTEVLPEGMEERSVGNTPGYKVVLPKGTTIRKEGDLRIIESSGEYAARRFAEYDEQLAKMNAEVEALKQEVGEIKKAAGRQ